MRGVRPAASATLPADSYLGGMLRTLWPGDAEPVTVSRLSRPTADATEFVVVPSLHSPRLVLPRRPRRVTAAALRNYKASATGTSRLVIRGLALAIRLGACMVLPDRIRIEQPPIGSAPSIVDFLEQQLRRTVFVALYIGPQRGVQKPVLQLLDAHGATFGFAKIGVTELTRALARSETDALTYLRQQSFDHLVVPKVLFAGPWQDHQVLVQEALFATESPSEHEDDLTCAMVELAESRGIATERLDESRYLSDLKSRIDAEPPSDLVATLRKAVDAVVETAGAHLVRFGSSHGDWAPWNMVSSGSRVMVWDLEQFVSGLPVGFDAVHYRIQCEVVISGRSPVEAFADVRVAAPQLLAPFGVDPSSSDLVLALYVLELATRYLHDGETEGETEMGHVHNWVPPVLNRILGIGVARPA
jgi:hypothetical protein